MDYPIDAKGKRLGRLASEIAGILQGKKDPAYDPRRAGDDRVLVANVEKIDVSGNKRESKIYYRHTGYMGHLKSSTLDQELAKDPRRVLREAVRRMLPKNTLNSRRLKNLIFVENNGKDENENEN